MALAILLSPFFFFLLSFFSSVLPFFLYLHKKNQETRKLVLPPSPTKLPIIGNLHQLGNLPHRSLSKLSLKYGPLMYLELGNIPTIIVSSADTAKEFLKIHDLDCCSRPFLTSTSKLTYNFSDIAFSPYGTQWRENRKISIAHFFSSKKVNLFQSIREEEVERMIESISNQSCIDLSLMLTTVSNDITCRAALGKKYDYSGGERGLHELLIETQNMMGGFFVGDYIPELGWMDVVTGMRGRLEKNFQELNEFFQRAIDEHVVVAKTVGVEEGRGDTIDALLKIQKDDPQLTMEHIKAILLV